MTIIDTNFPETMTAQEIFDHVGNFLLKQNAKSHSTYPNGKYRCMYRGDNGTACAVGCLIRDDEYKPEFEGNDVGSLIHEDVLPKRLVGHIALLRKLQNIHDMELVSSWALDLKFDAAPEFGLSTDNIKELKELKGIDQ